MYLSELMNKYKLDEKSKIGYLNLIDSPPGSGKTKYILDRLVNNDTLATEIFYVTDTIMSRDMVKSEYSELINEEHYIKDKVHVMTYYSFSKYLSYQNSNLYFKIIIFDEVHRLNEFKMSFNDEYLRLCESLSIIIDEEMSNLVYALSATPSSFTHLCSQYDVPIVDLLADHRHLLTRYKEKHTIKYNSHPVDLLKSLHFNKVLIYFAGHSNVMKQLSNELNAEGYRTEYLHSERRGFTTDQSQLRNHLLETGLYPDDLDILIINSAYETSWNIYDERVQTYISYATCHSYLKEASIIQSRARIRHDIDVAYLYSRKKDLRKHDKDELKNKISLDERINLLDQHLYKYLSTTEFKELCVGLDFRNPRNNRLLTGKNAIIEIEKLGYSVSSLTKNNKRYKYIEKS